MSETHWRFLLLCHDHESYHSYPIIVTLYLLSGIQITPYNYLVLIVYFFPLLQISQVYGETKERMTKKTGYRFLEHPELLDESLLSTTAPFYPSGDTFYIYRFDDLRDTKIWMDDGFKWVHQGHPTYYPPTTKAMKRSKYYLKTDLKRRGDKRFARYVFTSTTPKDPPYYVLVQYLGDNGVCGQICINLKDDDDKDIFALVDCQTRDAIESCKQGNPSRNEDIDSHHAGHSTGVSILSNNPDHTYMMDPIKHCEELPPSDLCDGDVLPSNHVNSPPSQKRMRVDTDGDMSGSTSDNVGNSYMAETSMALNPYDNDSLLAPGNFSVWLKVGSLELTSFHKKILKDPKVSVPSVIMEAASVLLKKYMEVSGLCSTLDFTSGHSDASCVYDERLGMSSATDDPHVQIHYVGSGHWVCSARHSKDGPVYLCDSLTHKNNLLSKSLTVQLAQVYGKPSSVLVVRLPYTLQQNSYTDSGLFAVAYATSFCAATRSGSPSGFYWDNYVKSSMREHLKNALEGDFIEKFPVKEQSIRNGFVGDVRIVIDCYKCPLPNTYQAMERCVVCAITFHLRCGMKVQTYGSGVPATSWYCEQCYTAL